VTRYRGLTWDHPRGYNALAAAAAALDEARNGVTITWDRQPLEGFESHPIADLCERYDLVVLDHPHIGAAVASHCLVALEEIFEAEDLHAWSSATIGPCFDSYALAGCHWALPLDAATQVLALRPDVIDDWPDTWERVVALSARQPVALSIAGPHAILTFFSVATALGHAPAEAATGLLVPDDIAGAALEILATLHGRMPREARVLNPIGLLRAMSDAAAAGSGATTAVGIALCPLVYGYVNYAIPRVDHGRPLVFHNAPRASANGRAGSTLGGTGIAVSRTCRITPALVGHLRWLMSREAQLDFIPRHDGQPSRREAWHDRALNETTGSFYRNTAATIEAAYVRPRYNGYIEFQSEASDLIRRGLTDGAPHRIVMQGLQRAYERSLRSALP
jgi:multiple sugar transport system substrate-binding protein